jgi:hypothetical protein
LEESVTVVETETEPTLDQAVELGVEAGLEQGIESDSDPTLDDLLAATLRESDDEPVEEPAAPIADETYTVVVDGEELEVTRDELLNGYQRQADYTRKTQTIPEDRQKFAAYAQLDVALQTNPQAVLEQLAEQFGVSLGAAPVAPLVEDPLASLEDPLEREIAELRQTVQSLTDGQQAAFQRAQEAERLAAVDVELDALRTQAKDPNFDEAALLQFALDNRIGSLDMAYRAMKQIESESTAVAEATRIADAKRALPPVEGGRSRSAGATRSGASSLMTLEQALEAAINDS